MMITEFLLSLNRNLFSPICGGICELSVALLDAFAKDVLLSSVNTTST